MEQVVRNFFFILKVLPGPCGVCCKKCCKSWRRFCCPPLYPDMRAHSPLYPSILRPRTKGDLASTFPGDRTPERRFLWGGSLRKSTSPSLKVIIAGHHNQGRHSQPEADHQSSNHAPDPCAQALIGLRPTFHHSTTCDEASRNTRTSLSDSVASYQSGTRSSARGR